MDDAFCDHLTFHRDLNGEPDGLSIMGYLSLCWCEDGPLGTNSFYVGFSIKPSQYIAFHEMHYSRPNGMTHYYERINIVKRGSLMQWRYIYRGTRIIHHFDELDELKRIAAK